MGTDRTQLFTLICNYPDAKKYTLHVNLEALKILDIDAALKIGKQYVALTEKAGKKNKHY